MSARLDGLRLAVGTFTALPVRPPQAVDGRTVRAALVWAPLLGALLGLAGAGVLLPFTHAPVLAASLAVATLAVATGGLHLDGLADSVDGLGSGRPREQALEIMRRSDVGSFGVAALVLTLLVQVAALAACVDAGRGPLAVVVATAAGRLAAVWGCARRVPAARTGGLGAAFAGTVPLPVALVLTAGTLAGAGLLAGTFAGVAAGAVAAGAVLAGLTAAGLLLRAAVRRLGGVTGDVLGAAVEVSSTAALVILAA